MKTRVILSFLLLAAIEFAKAQDQNIVVLINNNTQRTKELHVGDFVKVELVNSTIVKGTISLIDPTFMTVGVDRIGFDEILKFSTRKPWVRILGGGLIFSGLVISLTQALEPLAEPEPSDLAYVSLPLYGVGLAMLLPNYHEIDKYLLVVVPAR